MKIYISGPEDPEKRKQVAETLIKNGHIVMKRVEEKQSWIVSVSKRGKNALRLCLIAQCDLIFMLDGWQNSDIAKQEFDKAVEEKLTICFENGKGA